MSDQVNYIEGNLTSEEDQKLSSGFNAHRQEKIGVGQGPEPFSIKVYDQNIFVGVVGGNFFLGGLRITTLFVEEKYRGQGIAKSLIEKAESFALENKCHFTTVKTFNYQAPDFYKKLGYTVDFVRDGYHHDSSQVYLSKELV